MFENCCDDERSAVSVLAVSPSNDDHITLRGILSRPTWNLLEARTCEEVPRVIQENRTAVVICERDLPDGSWKDILDQMTPPHSQPLLIVASPRPDNRFWAEVLNLGAHDVIAKPFDAAEVLAVVKAACRRWACALTESRSAPTSSEP